MPRGSPTKPRTVRLTDPEWDKVQSVSQGAGQTAGEWMRRVLLYALETGESVHEFDLGDDAAEIEAGAVAAGVPVGEFLRRAALAAAGRVPSESTVYRQEAVGRAEARAGARTTAARDADLASRDTRPGYFTCPECGGLNRGRCTKHPTKEQKPV